MSNWVDDDFFQLVWGTSCSKKSWTDMEYAIGRSLKSMHTTYNSCVMTLKFSIGMRLNEIWRLHQYTMRETVIMNIGNQLHVIVSVCFCCWHFWQKKINVLFVREKKNNLNSSFFTQKHRKKTKWTFCFLKMNLSNWIEM